MLLRFLIFFIFSTYLSFSCKKKNKKNKKDSNKEIKLKRCGKGCKCSGKIRQYQEKKFIFCDKIIMKINNISIMFGTDKKGSTIIKGIGIKGPDGKTMYVRLTRNDKRILEKFVKWKSYHTNSTSKRIRKLVNRIFNNKKYDYKKEEYKPFIPEQEPGKEKPEQNPEQQTGNDIEVEIVHKEVDNDSKKNDVEKRQKNDTDGLEEVPSNEPSVQRKMGNLEKKFMNFNGKYCTFNAEEMKAIEPVGIDRIRRSHINILLGEYGIKNNSYGDITKFLNRENNMCTLYLLFQKLKTKLDKTVLNFLESLKNKIPIEPQSKNSTEFVNYAKDLLNLVDKTGYSKKLEEYAKKLNDSFYENYEKQCKDKYEMIKGYDKTLYNCNKEMNSYVENSPDYNETLEKYAKQLAGEYFIGISRSKDLYDSKIEDYNNLLCKYVKELYNSNKNLDNYARELTNLVKKAIVVDYGKCFDNYKGKLKKYLEEYSTYISVYKPKIKDYMTNYKNNLPEIKQDLDKFVKKLKEYNDKLTDYKNIDNYINDLINNPNSENGKSFSALQKLVKDIFEFVINTYPKNDDVVKNFNGIISFLLFNCILESKPIMEKLKCDGMSKFEVFDCQTNLSQKINIRNIFLRHDNENKSYEFRNETASEKLLFEKTEEDLLKEKEEAKKKEEEEKQVEEELKNEEFIRFKKLSEILGLSEKITVNCISSMKGEGDKFSSEKIFSALRGKISIDENIGNLIEKSLKNEIDINNEMIKNIRACYGIYIYAIYENFLIKKDYVKRMFVEDLITNKFKLNIYYKKLTLSDKEIETSNFLKKILVGVEEKVIQCKIKDNEEIKKKKEEQEKKEKEKEKEKLEKIKNELKERYHDECGYNYANNKCRNGKKYNAEFNKYEIFCSPECWNEYKNDVFSEDEEE